MNINLSENKDLLVLGIESSCDETAASVIKGCREVLSNVIYSQIDLHTVYGGVVPEIASRGHIEKIGTVVKQALSEAGKSLTFTLEEDTDKEGKRILILTVPANGAKGALYEAEVSAVLEAMNKF